MTRDIFTGMHTSLERVSMAGALETDSHCLRVDLSIHRVTVNRALEPQINLLTQ